MRLTTCLKQYTYLVELKGDLFCDSVSEVEKALKNAAEAYVTHVVIDCQQLRYISTEGINVLLSYRPILESRKIKLTLRHVNTSVLRVLCLLKLDTHFHLECDQSQ